MDGEQQAFPTLRPGGSIVSSRSRQFIDEILSTLNEGARDVLIDMRDVSFISKAAVVGIVEISEQLETEGGILALANLRGVVRNLISLRRSSRTLKIFDSDSQARNFLRKRIQVRALEESQLEEEETEKEESIERLDKVIEFLAAEEPAEEILPEEMDEVEEVEEVEEIEEIDEVEQAPLPSAEELAQGTFAILSSLSEAQSLSATSFDDEDEEFLHTLSPPKQEYVEPLPLPKPFVEEEEEEVLSPPEDILAMSDQQLSEMIKGQKEEPLEEPPLDEPYEELARSHEEEIEDKSEEISEKEVQPAGPETVFPVYDFDALAEKLRSSDPKTRWFAARGLGRLGDPRASSLLESLLKKSREFQFIREMARISLRRLGQPRP